MFKQYFNIIFLLLLLSVPTALFSQNIGINTTGTPPSGNAILDLNTGNSHNEGLIIPNVTLPALATQFTPPMAGVASGKDIGMMVYNSVATNWPIGYYYWNGTQWVSLSGGGGSISGAGTINYLSRWTSASVLGIGVSQDNGTGVGISTTVITPQNMLDVNGNASVGTYAGNNAAPAQSLIVSGQSGIGTNAPNASAALDLTSTTQGLLVPRMTIYQIARIAAPANGLLVYNTTSNCLEFYSTGSPTGWNQLSCACTGAPVVGTVSGPSPLCNSAVGTYSVATIANALSYTWSTSNSNLANLTSANGSSSATFTGAASGSGSVNITVVAANACGSSSNGITIWVGKPAAATTPVGPTTPTISTTQTYTCAAVSGATGYTWSTTSTNATISSGQGTQTVTVAYNATPTSCNICVTPTNTCGSGTQACLAVASTACSGVITLDPNASSSAFGGRNSNVVSITTSNTNDLVLVAITGYSATNRAYTGGAPAITGAGTPTATLYQTLTNTNSDQIIIYWFVAATAGTYHITVTETNLASGYYGNYATALTGFCSTPTATDLTSYQTATTTTSPITAPALTEIAGSYAYAVYAGYWRSGDGNALTWTNETALQAGSFGNGLNIGQAGQAIAVAATPAIKAADNSTRMYDLALMVIDIH